MNSLRIHSSAGLMLMPEWCFPDQVNSSKVILQCSQTGVWGCTFTLTSCLVDVEEMIS